MKQLLFLRTTESPLSKNSFPWCSITWDKDGEERSKTWESLPREIPLTYCQGLAKKTLLTFCSGKFSFPCCIEESESEFMFWLWICTEKDFDFSFSICKIDTIMLLCKIIIHWADSQEIAVETEKNAINTKSVSQVI